MAEIDYLRVLDTVEAIFKADPRLAGFTITQEGDPALDYPWLVIAMPTVRPRATFMTGLQGQSMVDTLEMAIGVKVVSVQGPGDARRQAHAAARTVMDVLRANYNFGGTVLQQLVEQLDFAYENGGESAPQSIYGTAVIRVRAEVIT